ncbi:hypothetical protein SAY87_013838 [Trapa incisa]|uniref:Uncharacterized protein n=1 Tax=Trapa incisa TaxID=236973 RepID=A0AAN7KBW2_9MYRT|nr:hypothetical protein SAY87_013838 [Trapa incisa]
MAKKTMDAAFQVVRYERANDPVLSVCQGGEPPEFWSSLAKAAPLSSDGDERMVKCAEESYLTQSDMVEIGGGKVDYEMDFKIFQKALAGGVHHSLSQLSNTGSETHHPAQETGWDRLRQRFASGLMREFITSSKLKGDFDPASDTALYSGI